MARWEPRGWTVFTKPWREAGLGELARHVRELGLDGVELPVRPGFQVSPDQVGQRADQGGRCFWCRGAPHSKRGG